MFSLGENAEYLITRPGLFKILTIVLGAVVVGLATEGIIEFKDSGSDLTVKETFLLISSIVSLSLSILYLIAHAVSDDLTINRFNRIFDSYFHGIIGVVLIVGGILMLLSGITTKKESCGKVNLGFGDICATYEEKLSSGILGIANGCMYIATGVIVQTSKIE